MAIKYDSNFAEGDFLPSSVVNNMIDSIKENEININKKIDKVVGKGLSTNDYTDEEKQKNANNADKLENLGFKRVHEVGEKTIYDYDDGVYAFSGNFKANYNSSEELLYMYESLMVVNSFNGEKHVLLFDATNEIISYFTITIDSSSQKDYSLSTFIKKIDYASEDSAGVVSVDNFYGIAVDPNNGKISISKATDSAISLRSNQYNPITPANLNVAVKDALTDSKHISMTDDEQKTAADVLNVEYRKKIVTSSTETTDVGFSIPYVDGRSNFDAFYNYAVSSIQINIQPDVPAGYECSFSFQSGENATSMLYSSGAIRFVGIDCDADGDFIPSANTNYEVSIKNLSSTNTIDNRNLIARVGVY